MSRNRDVFQNYLNEFKDTHVLSDDFRTFMVNHARFDKENESFGKILLETATALNHSYGIATAHLFTSWLYLDYDETEKMIQHTRLADHYYQKCEGLQKNKGHLSVLNNEIYYYRTTAQLALAYATSQIAIEESLRLNELEYYLTFQTNLTYILSEIGFVDKAIHQLNEIICYEDKIDMSNLLDSYFAICMLYVRNKNYERAEHFIELGLKRSINDYEIFKVCFYNMKAEIYLAMNDVEHTKKWLDACDQFMNHKESEYPYVHFLNVTKARYYVKVKEYEKAKFYYENSIESFSSDISGKSEISKEFAECLELMGEKEKAYDYLKIAFNTQKSMLDSVEEIYDHENIDLLEQFRNKTYEALYVKLQQVTKFGKSIFSSFDPDEILNQTEQLLKELFEPDYISILRLDPKTNCFTPVFLNSVVPFKIEGAINLDDSKSMVVSAIINQSEKYCASVEEEDIINEKYYPKEIRCRMIKPIFNQNIVTMVICVGSLDKGKFSNLELSLLEVIGDYVTTSVENAIQYNQTLSRIDLDSLTGIHNRSGIMKVGKEFIENEDDGKLGVLMIDIDDFKMINDNFGHLVGDEVLRKFGAVMKTMMNDDIQCGRFGGEEFLLFVRNMDSQKVEEFAKEVCIKIANSLILVDYLVSVSIGGTMMKKGCSLLQSIKVADEQCYIAKRDGRNRSCFTI